MAAFDSNNDDRDLFSSLMREKAEGRIPGIVGRLGDFGEIDAKYDVAASEALPGLDNIVIDTNDTLVKCEDFVAKNNLRSAPHGPQRMYMVLEEASKAMEWYINGNEITPPENVPRLFDLIKVKDKRLVPAFYIIAHDTLVADNLEMARSLRSEYRVVTLNGDFVKAAGLCVVWVGPESILKKGRMGITSAVEEEGCRDLNVEPNVREEENLQGDI